MIFVSLPSCLTIFIITEWFQLEDIAKLDSACCQYDNQLRNNFLNLLNSPNTVFNSHCSVNKRNSDWVNLRKIKLSRLTFDKQEMGVHWIKRFTNLDASRVIFLVCHSTSNIQTKKIIVDIINQSTKLRTLVFRSISDDRSDLDDMRNDKLINLTKLECHFCSKTFTSHLLDLADVNCIFLREFCISYNGKEMAHLVKQIDDILEKNMITLEKIHINGSWSLEPTLSSRFQFLSKLREVLIICPSNHDRLPIPVETIITLINNESLERYEVNGRSIFKFTRSSNNEFSPSIYLYNNKNDIEARDVKNEFLVTQLTKLFQNVSLKLKQLCIINVILDDPLLLSHILPRCQNSLLSLILSNVGSLITVETLYALMSSCPLLRKVELEMFTQMKDCELFAYTNKIESLVLKKHAKLHEKCVFDIVQKCPKLTYLHVEHCLNVNKDFLVGALSVLKSNFKRKHINFKYVI